MLNPFDMIFVDGPMARDIGDLALFFDAMTGFDPADPVSAPSDDGPFIGHARQPERPARVAWSNDLGCLPVEAEVRDLGAAFVKSLESAGVTVHRSTPDFTGALPALLTLRGAGYVTTWQPLLERHRHQFTPEVMGDIERGLHQSVSDTGAAERYRAEMYRRVIAFLQDHEFLITPSVTALPFPVGQRWLTEIDGQAQQTYIDWIAITAITSLLGCPVMALPVGFSKSGLPFGIQIIGRPRSEARLFRIAAWIEKLLALPPNIIDPRSPVSP